MKNKNHLLISIFTFCLISACNTNNPSVETPLPAAPVHMEPATTSSTHTDTVIQKASVIPTDFNLLRGDWERSDGGYVISIRNINTDGTLQAEYFNPKSIHVGKTKWETEAGNIFIMVELQDINYPGSTYTLQYFPMEDKLAGNYFQAVEGNNYEVMFARKK